MGLKAGYGDGYLEDPIPVSGVVNGHFHQATQEQRHALGHVVPGSDGTQWQYFEAGAALADDSTIGLDASFVGTNAGGTHTVRTDVPDGWYGFAEIN